MICNMRLDLQYVAVLICIQKFSPPQRLLLGIPINIYSNNRKNRKRAGDDGKRETAASLLSLHRS